MNRIQSVSRGSLALVVALAGALAAGGTLAQQSSSTSAGSPSTATSPSPAPSTSAMKGSDSMATSKAALPSRTDSASAAWQKIGSKGYVGKDDVRDLSGFSFDSADTNHDGRLSQDEFNKAWSSYSGASHPTTSNSMRGGNTMPSSSNSASGVATPK